MPAETVPSALQNIKPSSEFVFVQSTRKPILSLLVLASLITSSFAQNPYWAAKYSRFGGGKSPTSLEAIVQRFFEQTVLHDISIDAKTLPEALEQVRTALEKAHAEFGLGYTLIQPDYIGYSKPCSLHAKQLTLAAVVDKLAEQGNLLWSFNGAGGLTFYPPKLP